MSLQATPTTSPGLATRRSDFDTICEALDYAARGETGFNFFTAKGDLARRERPAFTGPHEILALLHSGNFGRESAARPVTEPVTGPQGRAGREQGDERAGGVSPAGQVG